MKKTRQFFSVLLTLAMLLSLLPTTAFAAGNPDPTAVFVDGGKSFYNNRLYYKKGDQDKNFTGNEGDYIAHYNPATGTLTLNGYSGGSISVGGVKCSDITVVLKGTNTINGSLENAVGGDITVTSSDGGTLSISKTTSGSNSAIGIETGLSASYTTGNVTIKGNAKVTINMTHNGTSTYEKAYGIFAKENIAISENASVDITCATPNNTTGGGNCNGLYAAKDVTIDTNGTIKIDVTNAGRDKDNGYSYGVYHMRTATLTKVGNMEVQWKKEGNSTRYSGGAFTKGATFSDTDHAINEDTTNCYASYRYGTSYYTVTAGNGKLTGPGVKYPNGNGKFLVGDTVNIKPNEKKSSDGTLIPFKEWTSEGVALASPTTPNTSFNVPTNDVTVTATYNPFDGAPVFTRTSDSSGTIKFKTVANPDNSEFFEYVKDGETAYNRPYSQPTTTSSASPYEYSLSVSTYYAGDIKNLEAGDYRMAVTLNGERYLSEKFTVSYTAAPVPSAAVDDVTIDGTTGTAIADKEVIITLANDTFASTLSGSWITNLPAGLSQSVSRTDDTHAKITVSGNPSAVSSDALIIKIPAASLASGSDLDVTGNANAKYNIKASVAALGGSAGITGTAKYNEILTADTSAITGNTGTFLYQWKRNGTDIPSAVNSTYKIVTEDIGKTITVAVSSSVESGTIVSPATATVGKADTPSAPTGLSGMKGKTLATVPLTGGWTWVDDTTVMNTAGMQTFKANYTDAAGNYENATNVDVTVNVTAKSTAALTGLTQSGCTYGETLSAPSYTKPAGTIDSTIKVTYMGKGGTTYAESATKPVKAGTYTVKVTLETADTTYSGTADFTIAQKDVTIRGFKVPNSAYNGDTKTSFDKTAAEIVGKITGDDVTIDTTAAEANFAQKDVGSDIPVNFTGVKLAGADKDNYRINSVEPAKANIYQRTLTVKPDSGLSKKYGEADPALSSTVSGTISGEVYALDGKLEREAGENVGNYKILLGTLALKDNGAFKASNYILSLDTTAVYFEIKKAAAPSAPTGLSGMKGKTLATVPLTGGWAWADDTTVMNTAGTQTFKTNYTDTTGNYENATNVDVTVEVIDKTNVSASITFADGKLTYNGAGQAYETASISGITAGANPGWTYAYVPSGTGSLDASGKPQNAGTYTVTATYEDDDNYGTKSAVLEIKKAVPTGTPKYTEITTAGKTLADAAITTTGADFSVPGAVIWVADDGVTPLPDTTVVAANTYYKWLFTPTDTDNYETLTGTIRLYRRSSGGGGGRSTSRYTVSFESNGGSKVSNQTVTRNSVMKEPTAPTKENFDFDGWYSDKELKTKYDFSAKVTKSFTLYAKWTEKDNSINQIVLTIGKKDAQVFGKAKSNDVAPKIEKDRTMLPARFVAENLGAKVEWDGEKQLVTITGKNLKTDENVTILITIGSATVKVNGKEIKLDSPAFIENDRTYTPIRFISENLGASVEWVEKDQKVIITKPEIKKAETK